MARLAESTGFPPIARGDARLLILGTLPSQASLEARQYYAHPRNAFWRIMAELFGAEDTYAERCQRILQHGIAVWDVLQSSVRPGSMDADIRTDTARVNDFVGFFDTHPDVAAVCFNGKKAQALYQRMVEPATAARIASYNVLPSTSPAHASLNFAAKLKAWRAIAQS